MSDKKSFSGPDLHHIKEAICVDTNRVYDSCADKDCLTDLRVYLTDCNQHILEASSLVRPRSAQILNCIVEVEKVPFNRGCYSVDLTFFVKVTLDALTCPTAPPSTIEGLVTFGKKCILYGSDGNVKIFTSKYVCDGMDEQIPVSNTNPKAKVQCVDPIILDAQICRICDCCNTMGDCCESLPRNICRCFEGNFGCYGEKAVKVTLGIFTIIQLERDVQMLIPAYDFCIPGKECFTTTDDPCEVFKHIKFPTSEFFPPRLEETDGIGVCSCGCG